MKPLFALAAALVLAPAALLADDAPPPSVARQGDFMAAQITTTNPDALLKTWAQPGETVHLDTQTSTTRNLPIHTFITFAGCKPDPAGKCHITASFQTFDPAGKPYDKTESISIFNAVPPPRPQLALGEASMGLRIEDGEPLGDYKVMVLTTDQVAGITVKTEQVITVNEMPIAGGWQAIPNPGTAAELRGPVKAMLAKLPRKKPRLSKIETAQKQIVAGTNYRLQIKLKDGTRWEARVWRKLDGTYEVSGIGQVR